MKRYISIVASAICFINLFLAIGIVGSIECETLSVKKGLISICTYLIIALVGVLVAKHFDD